MPTTYPPSAAHVATGAAESGIVGVAGQLERVDAGNHPVVRHAAHDVAVARYELRE